MASSATTTPRKLTALPANRGAGPTVAAATPPSAMPRIRPHELTSEPSDSALVSAPGSTIVEPNRPIAGPSTALTTPPRTEMAYTTPSPPTWLHAAAASSPARPAWTSWVHSSSGRPGTRSASAPAHGLSSSTGSDCSSRATPIRPADPVACSTYQLTASDCIQVPLTDTKPAPIQIRKLRSRRAMKRVRRSSSVLCSRTAAATRVHRPCRSPASATTPRRAPGQRYARITPSVRICCRRLGRDGTPGATIVKRFTFPRNAAYFLLSGPLRGVVARAAPARG